MSLAFRISAPYSSYVVGEGIVLEMALENHGTSSVHVPDPEANASAQPAYQLFGPGSEVVRFDFRSVVQDRAPGLDSPETLIEIPAGGTWSGHLSLSDLVPIRGPGSYKIVATLSWKGLEAQASASFTVVPLSARALDMGLSATSRSSPEIHVAWRHEWSGGQSTIFQAGFIEARPDLGEVKLRGVTRSCEVPPGASEIVVPWAARSRLEDLVGWVLWREGHDLCGQSTMGRGRLRVRLPFNQVSWAFPAIESQGHDVDLFCLGGEAMRTLAMIRIHYNGFAKPPDGKVAWTTQVPANVVTAAVAALPEERVTPQHIALVSAGANGIAVHHAVVDGQRPPRQFVSATFENCQLVRATPPALLATSPLQARVTVLTTVLNRSEMFQLHELMFGPDDAKSSVTGPPFLLPSTPREAQVRYYSGPGGSARRGWAVRTADNATFVGGPSDEPVMVQAPVADPAPLVLLVLRQHSYLLQRLPSGGFEFTRT